MRLVEICLPNHKHWKMKKYRRLPLIIFVEYVFQGERSCALFRLSGDGTIICLVINTYVDLLTYTIMFT